MRGQPLDTLRNPSAEVSERDRVGVYRIESLLGRGGMGEVFLAWDEILERHVAIKQVLSLAAGDSSRRQRFLREARAVARLDHPAIVRVYHVLEREDGDCLVMEYVRGKDLAKVAAAGRVSLLQSLLLARGIAEGLAEAHAAGLIHRDLKLANVMVTLSGSVKILDFGLAKAREPLAESILPAAASRAAESDLTGAGAIVGTAFAMSPEQAAGGELDPRSDLFSLGSLLYELLAGVRPFQGSSVAETLEKVMAADPEPLESRLPDLPRELAGLVQELLARQKRQRPPSAQAVADRLAEILDRLGESSAVARPAFGLTLGEDDPTAVAGEPTAREPILPFGRIRRPSATVELRTVASLALGDRSEDRAVFRRRADSIVSRFDAQEVAGDGIEFLFRRPAEAVAFALAWQGGAAGGGLAPRRTAGIALHLGELTLPSGFGPVRADDHAELFARVRLVASHARDGQTLLTRAVFDLARGARAPAELADEAVRWLAHGSYLAAGEEAAIELFEVGRAGHAPLVGPLGSLALRRAPQLSQDAALGWRPAVGQEVPRRPGWRLAERLGEGGFGEVWLARHDEEGQERVFKLCFDPLRLRALKREVTIFRLLRETLGHRQDIARLISWDFEEAPYFLESAYTDGGDLLHWANHRGGLAEIPLATRLDLVAQVAEALAAAHSVGVLHKDVKPQNVLVSHDEDGRPRALLTDFGLGLLTRREALQQPGFTVLGFTEGTPEESDSKAGTARYMAPELSAGQPATIAADVYSLGILLYQLVVGDFGRSPVEGWRREIEDHLLADDIAACVDGSPERRLRSPAELAERLRSLEERRQRRRHEEEEAAAGRRAQRRRRLARWLSAAAAVLVPILSVFAYVTYEARNEEKRARQQAERRRQQAESLIDFMLGDLRQQLQPIGKLKILDQVGDQALAYFAAVPEGELSPAEMASYSKALHQIGQVRFGLGKKPEAAEAFEASLAMAKRLAASDPANSQWLFDLGQSHFWVGFLKWKERKLDQALAEFEAYLRISEGLVARNPQNQDWQLELAFSHSNLGTIMEERNQLDVAARNLESSLRIFEELLLRRSGSHQLLVEAANLKQKLGELLHRRGDLPGSLSLHLAALTNYEKALEIEPDDAQLLVSAATAMGYVGNVLQDQGHASKALEYFLADMETMQKLAERDPENFTYKEFSSLRINKVGRAFLAAGNLPHARLAFERDRELTSALVARNGETPGWQFANARNRCSWALFFLTAKSPQTAVAHAEACRTRLEALVAKSPDRQYRLWLSLAYLYLGYAFRDAGATEKPPHFWSEGAKIALPLVESSPLPAETAAFVRLTSCSGNSGEADAWIARLASIGYQESTFQGFLDPGKSAASANHCLPGRSAGRGL